MKFLRMPNKAQILKQASSLGQEQNKENMDPSKLGKPILKSFAAISKTQSMQEESSTALDQNLENSDTMNLNELGKQSIFQKNDSLKIEAEEPLIYKREQEHYQKQILEFLIDSVRQPLGQQNYFNKQPDVTEHMRMVLLNWIIDVHLKYKLNPQTLFITVNMIDEFLTNQIIYRNELQLVGITALWIAAKYEQTYQVPKLSNLVYICDKTYTDIQILNMQSRILEEIKFDFLKITSLTYFETLKRYTMLTQKDYFLGRYLLEIVLFDVSSRKYSDLVIAASVIFFIQKLRGYELLKQQKINEISKLNQKQLRNCAREVCFLWRKMNQIQQMGSLRQKFMKTQFLQVAKIKISEKNAN